MYVVEGNETRLILSYQDLWHKLLPMFVEFERLVSRGREGFIFEIDPERAEDKGPLERCRVLVECMRQRPCRNNHQVDLLFLFGPDFRSAKLETIPPRFIVADTIIPLPEDLSRNCNQEKWKWFSRGPSEQRMHINPPVGLLSRRRQRRKVCSVCFGSRCAWRN